MVNDGAVVHSQRDLVRRTAMISEQLTTKAGKVEMGPSAGQLSGNTWAGSV